MDFFSWIAQEAELSDAALTVRAQALPPDDRDQLIHDVFFPRQDVDSTTIQNITTQEFRPASDRREWNTRGRLIPQITPVQSALEMIPIEAYFTIHEQEIQKLVERVLGERELMRRIIGTSVPARTDQLVRSNQRRMEFDALQAWSQGTVTVMNPQLGHVQTVSYGIGASRYSTAATPWNATTVNAYEEFLAWIEDGIDAIGGGVAGVVLRRSSFRNIQIDAPQGLNGIPLTRAQFENQVRQDLGQDFNFYIVEHRLDKFIDGGLEYVRQNVWPASRIALVPAGVRVGFMAYAPVARAFELARVNQDAEIDVRGQSVFREVAGNGRSATFEAQVNSFPVPNPEAIWVINDGVPAS